MMTTDHGGVMPPCVRIECGVCYSRLSKLKVWTRRGLCGTVGRVLVVRDRAEDLRKVIALVQDGPKTGESREYRSIT